MGVEQAGEPTVSCIIIAHNEERHIGEAIESALAQTHPPLEIIAVDDGSTDRTPQIVASYPPPVRHVRQEQSGGAAARNRGAREARGDLLAFLDGDDVWYPHKLARQVSRFAARPELAASVCHLEHTWYSPERETAEKALDPRLAKPVPSYGGSAWMVRRSSFFDVGPLNEELHHAGVPDWFMRAQELGAAVELLPDALAVRRIHDRNISRARASASRSEVLQVLKASLDRRRQSPVQPARD